MTEQPNASTADAASSGRLRRFLTEDHTSGLLLLAAAVIGVVWANSPWRDAYHALLAIEVGPQALNLNLSLSTWAADGLLAIFFFVVGVELKNEFVSGSLREPKMAAVPVVAAVGGMITPALCYVVIVGTFDPEGLHGWAIPTATDIAFALAVLAIFGRGLPVGLRAFLLTLAVVDDLLAIVVIATFYTETINPLMLLGSLAMIGVFALVVRAPKPKLWAMIPVALIAWGLMHEAGVHATIAGVLMGFAVPASLIHRDAIPRTERFQAAMCTWSAGLALPLFAFAAAGVTVIGEFDGIVQPVSIGIVVGLLVGKVVGVLGATFLMTRLTPLRLAEGIGMRDLAPVGILTGVGFTVSLLIAELSFDADSSHASAAKAAILTGSVLAAGLAAILLRLRARQLAG